MTNRIVIPYGVKAPDTTPPASAYDLETKIRAAIAAGVFVAVGLTALMWAALALIRELGGRPPWKVWLVTLALALLIGLGVVCWFGYDWAIRVAKRPWDVDDDEREYARAKEKAALEAQEEAAAKAKDNIRSGPMDHDRDPDTLSLEQRYWLVAHEMLSRACLGRGKPTRDAMEADRVCSQAEWNLINEAMCKIGLRNGYTWRPTTFEQAWDTFRANFRVQVHDDGEVWAWAMRPGGKWAALERVA